MKILRLMKVNMIFDTVAKQGLLDYVCMFVTEPARDAPKYFIPRAMRAWHIQWNLFIWKNQWTIWGEMRNEEWNSQRT